VDVPLIGRDSDIARLRALVAESPVVFVYGPAGVGKTALVNAALAGSAETNAIPDVVLLSLEGVVEARDAVERSARAMGVARPSRSGSEDDDLVRLFATKAATLVWDDLVLEASVQLAPLVARFASQPGPSRLVLVSRRFMSAKEVGLRAPVFEVQPLEGPAAVELVRAVEAARGRTLAEDVARATGGNPRLIQLALAGDALGARIAGDGTDVLRRTIEEGMRGAQATVLALLSAAGAPLDAAEVARAAGKGGDAAIDELRKHLVVVREGARVSIAAPAIELVREIAGDVPAATWKALAKIAERILAASPNDGAALLVAARAHVEIGAPADALAVLKRHPLARASADLAGLERVLRAIAAESAAQRLDALRLLAREQLRAGDYEAARRTLDDLPKPRTREDAERAALLRAECYVRAGEPEAAQRALDELPPRRGGARLGPAFALAQAQLGILRGELSETRALAERLAPETARSPALEARRAVEMAASWLYEERYERTHEWVTHARAALRSAGRPLEPVVTILDVHSLLGLGLVERAEEVIDREARGRPIGPMLEVALLVRRGEARRALALGDVALAALGQRTDLLFRSVVARDLARAAMAIGDLGRAAKLLRLTEAGADEPGLAALRPICDAEGARLALARGDHGRAVEMIERAAARIPSPFIEIDREVIRGRVPRATEDAPAIVRAYAALRGAEGAVVTGALAEAVEMAESAAQFHLDSGLHHEAARAELALAEAVARLGLEGAPGERPPAKNKKEKKGKAAGNDVASASRDELLARAERAVDACVSIAVPRGYSMIVVGASLVRAAVCEARGDLDAATSAIGDALRAAGDKADASLLEAARRVGAISDVDPGARAVARGPWAPMIERLGLSRQADVVWRIGARSWLRGATDPPPERVACAVEVDTRRVRADDGRFLSLPEQRIALLCALAEAGPEGATLEELFARVWKGTFHPLRHRNAVYVALARLKDSLKPFAGDVRIAHDGERYRLAGDAPVAVRRRVDHGR
jgi:tetratricopeptide (TPR) repeat protein